MQLFSVCRRPLAASRRDGIKRAGPGPLGGVGYGWKEAVLGCVCQASLRSFSLPMAPWYNLHG